MAAKTDKTAMAKAAKKADALLREMVAITLKSDLSRIQRTNLETCITVHMHQKETSGALTLLKMGQIPVLAGVENRVWSSDSTRQCWWC